MLDSHGASEEMKSDTFPTLPCSPRFQDMNYSEKSSNLPQELPEFSNYSTAYFWGHNGGCVSPKYSRTRYISASFFVLAF